MDSEGVIVSVVIPVRNEEKYIEQCIISLLNQDFPKENLEIIFVDGVSNDRTKEIIGKYISEQPRLFKLLDNPNITVPYALNTGIRNALGKYFFIMGAHGEYAVNYISKCVYFLENTDADNVGGPVIAKGKNNLQKVIAASYHSKFALGGGKHHDENYEGYADTLFPGSYKKETLVNIGMYDEKFTRNQDDELNYRLVKSGGKIFVTHEIKCVYYPRDSYKKLFRQYFEYGFWRVAFIKKHGVPARITQLVPAFFVLFLALFLAALVLFKPAALACTPVLGLYLIMNFYFSFTNRHIEGMQNKLRLVLIHFMLHFSYGTGFIIGVSHFLKIGVRWRPPKLWKVSNKSLPEKREGK